MFCCQFVEENTHFHLGSKTLKLLLSYGQKYKDRGYLLAIVYNISRL